MMESVHTNAAGIAIARVMYCELPMILDDEWIWSLRPKSHGCNSTPFNITRTSSTTRWQELIVNKRQVVERDIVRPIAKRLGWRINDPRIVVTTDAAVPTWGESNNPGSPRTGVVHNRRNRQRRQGVSAR